MTAVAFPRCLFQLQLSCRLVGKMSRQKNALKASKGHFLCCLLLVLFTKDDPEKFILFPWMLFGPSASLSSLRRVGENNAALFSDARSKSGLSFPPRLLLPDV